MARISRIKNKQKAKASFIGSTIVGIKAQEKTVFSKRQGKNVKVIERTGAVALSDGTFLKFQLSKSSDAKFKETGVAYWLEVAEFENSQNER